ncbi:MAG: leucine-rich repeat protein [Oscillospiraceae bacterium]|nr:leucine-rich repeat protein [Oscillospiraceae bacterium]
MKKRVLSLLLCFVLAAGLLSVCAPPAQAGTIAGAFEQFIQKPGQIKKLFGNEVAHGDCGPAGNEASVHYKIYEVTNPTVVQDNPFLQQIWQIHDYREDAQYYGVYIFGDGPMADYAVKGQKAPWMGNVEVTEYNDKGQKLGTTVVENLGEEYLALAYIAGATTEEWDGKKQSFTGVTNVGNRAFKDCQYLTCMFLDDGITTIGDRAFYEDEYLSAINMPRDLELIDQYAFYGCDTLTFVRAGACSRLRRIEDHAFYSCTMLAELRLPNGLTYIGPWAFAWDRILGQEDTTLGLPSSLQVIDTGAFAFVNHHKNLNIPANVTSIGDYAFMCDYYMNNLTFSPGDKPLTIGKAAFAGDNHMKSVDLSNRVAQIDKCAFAGCELLEEAYFGDRIDTIQARAFTSVDAALQFAIKTVLNGILDPDNPDGNEEHADDIAAGLTQIAKITQLKRAVFKNDPAKSIYGAADSNRSFPDDCVVYYTQGSHTWAAALKDDGTWQGYKTGLWHGDHIAQFADTVVDPTCTKQGYTHHVCTVKGCTYAPVDDTYVAATDHTWVKTQTNPPACTEQGTAFYKCSACGATRTEKIAALGHDLSRCDLVPDATCTQPGRAVGTCARCGVKIDEVIPAKGHDYSYKSASSTEPTCTESGRYQGTCPRCGKEYNDTIPALGHDWGEWVVAQEPTAETTGYRYHLCARCNTREGEDIPKLHEHAWNAGVVTQKPTATEPGVKTFTCTICGATKTESIPATGLPGTCPGGPTCPGYAFRDMPVPADWSHEGLDYCIYRGYVAGTSASTVSPTGVCTRAQLVSILYRMQGEPTTVKGYELSKLRAPFDDVPRGQWYTDAIWWAKLTGVVAGTSATTFDPEGEITREQLAVILYNYTQQFAPGSIPAAGSLAGFPDAGSVSSWARTEMAWAVGNGLISGTGSGGVAYLSPQGSATRAQVAAILMRFEQAMA